MKDVLDPLRNIPLSVNTAYGDAFQPTQWPDTLAKVREAVHSGFRGHLMIGTKYVIPNECLDELRDVAPNCWIILAVTGLRETKRFSDLDYERFYFSLSERFPRTVVAVRPIIPGRNDRIDLLDPIIQMASRGARLLTFTGFRDPYVSGSQKHEDRGLFKAIRSRAHEVGVVARMKCACIVAEVTGEECAVHSTRMPGNLDTLRTLGYDLDEHSDRVELVGYRGASQITKGDLSFARLIARSSRLVANVSSPSEILQFRVDGLPELVCTSSFFDWARQTKCYLSCDYCFANLYRGLGIPLSEFGGNPVKIAEEFNRGLPGSVQGAGRGRS